MTDKNIIQADFSKKRSSLSDEALFELEEEIITAIEKAKDDGVWPCMIISILQLLLTQETIEVIRQSEEE